MQPESDFPQESLAFFQDFKFLFRNKAVLHQAVKGFSAEMPLGNPADDLDVTQTAGVFFDIRFQAIRGVAEAVVSGDLLFQLGLKKIPPRPDALRPSVQLHLFEQGHGACDWARFQQVGGDGDVLFGLGNALA